MARRELPAAVKELAFHIRDRLELCVARGAPPDYPAIEALIILQKSVESAEAGDPEVAAKMIAVASGLLLETPLFAGERHLLDRWVRLLAPVETS